MRVVLTVTTILFVMVMYLHINDLININHLPQTVLNRKPPLGDRWIIVDVIDRPMDTTQIDVPGWILLILGDTLKNKIRCISCIHFDENSADTLLKPFHLSSKPVHVKGVFYIINMGAEYIIWGKDVKSLIEEVKSFKTESWQTGMTFKDKGILNLSQHFTCANSHENNLTLLYRLQSLSVPCIQKVWRPLSMEGVDHYAPPVIVPSFIYHMESLKGSLFHRNLFWCLAPLLAASPDKMYIWSFWIQRLMLEFDGTTKFLAPVSNNAVKEFVENTADSIVIQNGHINLGVLREKLSKWQCKINNTFYDCVSELTNFMVGWSYFSPNEHAQIINWMLLLNRYEPKRTITKRKTYMRSALVKIKRTKEKTGYRMAYNPCNAVSVKTFRNEIKYEMTVTKNPFYSVCQQDQHYTPYIKQLLTTHPIDDILLIIIFNHPGYLKNIKYLSYMYGRHFSHIVICGDALDEFSNLKFSKRGMSFIEINVHGGIYSQQCMMEAMKIGYDVNGYLQISDDVLLNVWNIDGFPKDKIWFQKSIRAGNLSIDFATDIDTSYLWWGWKPGRKTVQKVLKELSLLLQDQKVAWKIQNFLNNLELNSGNNNSAFYEASDIYYVPAKLKNDYIYFTSLFWKYKVFHEIAIPTIISGLVSHREIVRMSGSYLWNNRDKYKEMFNISHVFLHPFKLGKNLKIKSDAEFICKRYLTELDSYLINGRKKMN